MKINTYHVLNMISGKWLDADERSWTGIFGDSAAFSDAALARDIARRETGPTGLFYILGHVTDLWGEP